MKRTESTSSSNHAEGQQHYHRGSTQYPRRNNTHRSASVSDFDEEEDYLDDEDDMLLMPGEPRGAFLQPVEEPYNRADKVEEANRLLFSSPMSRRSTRTRVRVREDLNEYFVEVEEDYERSQMSIDIERPVTNRRSNPSQGSFQSNTPQERRSDPRNSMQK